MRFKKLIAVAVVVLGSLSLGGAALAANGHANPKAAAETSSVDTDTLQIGDQTTPDVGKSAESGGTETSSEAESSENAPSDGPGGWADPAGNVDNQFEGVQ